ncbi:MAG: ABC transporter permease [Candidatus Woesearchaeota archaeon]
MRLSKIFKLSLNMLLHSKLRSWLTIIGIFIGVAAVVAIISIGTGLQETVNSQLQGLGQDIISISSGSSRAIGPHEGGGGGSSTAKALSDRDIQTLKLVAGIKSINPVISGRATVKYLSESTSQSITGQNPSVYKDFVTTELATGRDLSTGDTRAVVIGDRLANKVFKTQLNVGSIILINDKPFRIIGILKASTGMGNDNGMYMTLKDAREVLGDSILLKSNEYSSISVKVSDADMITEVSDKIDIALMNAHHVAADKKDFSIMSSAALQERFSTMTAGITLFLSVIAAISLLVGGIGVANTMFTSVLEKTKDIGVMKAIGAKNSDILLIFLLNSGMLGLVGGLLGIFASIGLIEILPYLGLTAGSDVQLTIPINFWLLAFSVAFSMGIGMIFGAIPAYNASKLKPVDALRYE